MKIPVFGSFLFILSLVFDTPTPLKNFGLFD